MSLEKKVNEFKKLSFENKREKVLKILEILKWSESLFDDLYKIITNIKNISEELLISIYASIESTIENIDNDKLKNDIDSMGKVRKRLQKIKEMEEEEEEKNNNPEKLLEQL